MMIWLKIEEWFLYFVLGQFSFLASGTGYINRGKWQTRIMENAYAQFDLEFSKRNK